ncbi:hypothetical protein IFT92_13325 [Peribacillus simplex]|uniref:CopG family transcriptional regulator n=1 Tax=Peribacillus simplex TaxID=1478 RepID=A0AAN2PLD4_9BACI|nr:MULTISPECIES: hypothetical protein [Peribacillus]MCP1094806.1 hypothetical protein [Bacillaceae bacterium OS4b]MBD8588778.1 hypothetical protein [Peribacillus simplex]MCP1155195.1 hypothetical protein [Peribacillus frigoritolerans]MCT1390652.1 hypothetical protein [Peribacillus frigoritolerans]MEA3576058.1 hypothetical protein [Peribacillus frigoritolerans]
MKIGKILELIKTDTPADIAKRAEVHLSEESLRKALNKAGYEYRNSGKKGWYFVGEGDEETVQEQLIYDFATAGKVSTNVNKEPINDTNQRSNVGIKSGKEQVKQANEQSAPTIERTNVIRKRSSFDMDVELMKELKIQAIIHDRTVYELVECAVRHYLAELKGK